MAKKNTPAASTASAVTAIDAESQKSLDALEVSAVTEITGRITELVTASGGDLAALELDGKSSAELAIVFNDLTIAAATDTSDETPPTGDPVDAAIAKAAAEATKVAEDAAAEAIAAARTEAADATAEAAKATEKAAKATAAAEVATEKAAKATAAAEVAAAADPDGTTLTNTGINRRCINCIDLAVGDSYELTERDLADDRLMAKVRRAVTLGILART